MHAASGGLLSLDNRAFDEQSFSGGGIVAFAGGREVDAKTERRKQLMAALSNSDYVDQHELIRRELRAMDGVTPLRGLRDLPGFIAPDDPNETASMPQFDRGRMEDLRGFTTPKEENPMPQFDRGRMRNLRGFLAPEDANPVPEFDRGKMKNLSGFLTPEGANSMPQFDRGRMEDLRGFTTPDKANPMPKFGIQPPTPAFSLDSYQPKKWEHDDALNQRGLGATTKNPPPPAAKALPSSKKKSDTPFIDMANRTSRTPPGVKDNPDQTQMDLDGIIGKRREYMGPEIKFEGTSAEDKAARKQEDLWSTLAQIGFGTAAGTSQHALENIGKGAAGAMPAMQEAMKNRRADEKEERKMQFESLLAQRKERGEGFDASMREFGRLDDKKQALTLANMKIDSDEKLARIRDATDRAQIAASERNAQLTSNSYKNTDAKQMVENIAKQYIASGISSTDAYAMASRTYLESRGNPYSGLPATSRSLDEAESNLTMLISMGGTDDQIRDARAQVDELRKRARRMADPKQPQPTVVIPSSSPRPNVRTQGSGGIAGAANRASSAKDEQWKVIR
mgnify:CR=1 FL=1